VKIRLNNNPKIRHCKYWNYTEEISNSNTELRLNLEKYLLRLVLGYEKTVKHKLNILILGSIHHNLGIALADYGHKITFITWDIDDHKNLNDLIKKSKLESQIYNQLIDLKAIESLIEIRYDLLLSLTPFYRLLTNLNFDKQKTFFEYVLKNIDSAVWIFPKNDERNPLNIYFPNQRELDFYRNYDYVSELAGVKISLNSAEYPILYTSNALLFIDSKFYKNNFVNVIRSSESVFSRVYFVKNKLYKVSLSNSNIYSSSVKEFKFISNLRFKNKIKLGIPINISSNEGLVFDTSKRKKINGIDLHKIKTIDDSHEILKEFIQLCRKFSKAKIYHNDIRPWNILWNGKKCVFIDFEYSSKYDQDTSNYPQILYFFAMANYIKKLDQLKVWDIENIIQQNSEYLYSNEAHKLFYASWEKISTISLSELLKIDYLDVKQGFKQLIELLESY